MDSNEIRDKANIIVLLLEYWYALVLHIAGTVTRRRLYVRAQ